MKNFLTIALIATVISAQASILNLNNAANSPGQYTTAASAIAAAVAGDTILIAGTDLSYGNFTIDKSISLIGPGWVVNGGGISRVAICGNITIGAHNVRVEGLRFAVMNMSNSSGTSIDNLSVKRCISDDQILASSENINNALIEGCLFTKFNDYNLSSSSASWNFSNCTVRNNIFSGQLYNVDNSVIVNNIFLGTNSLSVLASALSLGNVFQGNIAIGRNLASLAAGNTISGNLGYTSGGTVWNGSGNVNDANPNFVSYINLALHDWTNNYNLQPGSPAIGLGPGGDDAGIYSGSGVYRKDGEPSVPIVRAVAVPGGNTVPANSTFTINLTTVSHE